jgi:hypothetical protein
LDLPLNTAMSEQDAQRKRHSRKTAPEHHTQTSARSIGEKPPEQTDIRDDQDPKPKLEVRDLLFGDIKS